MTASYFWPVSNTTYLPSPEMSGNPDPAAAVGSLAPAVVPAARLRTTESLTSPAGVSPGRRLFVPVGASNATTLPSALIAGRSVVPFACTPAAFTAASTVVPAAMSRTTTSASPTFASGAIKLVAVPVVNAIRVPL